MPCRQSGGHSPSYDRWVAHDNPLESHGVACGRHSLTFQDVRGPPDVNCNAGMAETGRPGGRGEAQREPLVRRHEHAAQTLPRRHMHLPFLLTSDETAELLRTTKTAVYSLIARGQLPGVTRLGRRVLIRRDDLLDWLDQKRTPSPKEDRR